MPDSLTVRRAEPSDTPAIVALLHETMGEGASRGAWSEAFWRWKHEVNPYGVSPVLLAEDAGRIVALRAFMRWTWAEGTRERPAVRAVDTVTHADYRGRGLFRRLTMQLVDELAAEGVHFVYNTPNAQSGPGYLKMGWEAVGRVPVWTKPLRPLHAAQVLATKRGADEAAPPDLPEAVALTSWSALPDLLGGLPSEARVHTRRTAEALTWRYVAIPDVRYHAAFEAEREPVGLVARTRVRKGLVELSLADVLVPEGGEGAAARLIRRACRASGGDYAVAIAAWGTPAAGALLRSGFVPLPRTGPLLTVRELAERPPASWSDWAPCIGDLELF